MDLQLSEYDWQFKTTPQKHLNNRVSFWPRGKVLGGCSSTNAMIYVRGNPGARTRRHATVARVPQSALTACGCFKSHSSEWRGRELRQLGRQRVHGLVVQGGPAVF